MLRMRVLQSAIVVCVSAVPSAPLPPSPPSGTPSQFKPADAHPMLTMLRYMGTGSVIHILESAQIADEENP